MWEEEELNSSAQSVCRDLLGGAWGDISPEEIIISQVSGGLSNRLYLCRLPADVGTVSDEPRDVILRIYGDKIGSNVTSVVCDSVIFLLLAERKLGPQLYGIFPNGRLEEYIPSRCATWKDLRRQEVFLDVAKELAKAHVLRVPIKKQPTWLLDQMRSWWNSVVNNVSMEDLKPSQATIAEEVLNASLEKEIDWLESQIQRLKSPLVFSHNDLQGGNVLLLNKGKDKADNSLMLIDYEFCSYNFRGFDIGNHFCEWCFSYSEPDYPYFNSDLDRFPTEEQQRMFIRAYLMKMEEIQQNVGHIELEQEILNEVPVFAASAHLLWTLWSFHMALTSSISFGFWEYSRARLEAYFCQKSRCINSKTATAASNVSNGFATEQPEI